MIVGDQDITNGYLIHISSSNMLNGERTSLGLAIEFWADKLFLFEVDDICVDCNFLLLISEEGSLNSFSAFLWKRNGN